MLEGVLLSIANGIVSVGGMVGICQSAMAMQILTKALAMYSADKSWNAFLKAVREDNIEGMLLFGLNFALDVAILNQTCFDGDTPVATEAGFKCIDEIQVGDRVWSYNVETGEKSLKEVKQVFVKESDEILHLETTEGGLDATTNHPFYVIGKGWVVAGDLLVGDKVHTLDGDAGTVTGFNLEKLYKPIPVYNIEVEDFHSYFVGNGVLVHNVYLEGRGSTGRTEPMNLMEEMAYEAAKASADPFQSSGGNTVRKVVDSLGDPRWLGWQKWEIVVRSKNGKNVTIHFVFDAVNNLFDDFKLKN